MLIPDWGTLASFCGRGLNYREEVGLDHHINILQFYPGSHTNWLSGSLIYLTHEEGGSVEHANYFGE